MSKLEKFNAIAPTAQQQKFARMFREISKRKSKALSGLTGSLVFLPFAVGAQEAGDVALSSAEGVKSYRLLETGQVEVSLDNGQTVLVNEGQVVSAAEGEVVVSDLAA